MRDDEQAAGPAQPWDEENRAWSFRAWVGRVLARRVEGLRTAEEVYRAVEEGRLRPGQMPQER